MDGPIPRTVQLTRWARAEGTLRAGAKLQADVAVAIEGTEIWTSGAEGPSIFTSTTARTNAQGRYQFDRVFPGEGRIGRDITFLVGQGATEVVSSIRVPAHFVSGATAQLDVGGDGRPIVGKLDAQKGISKQIHWRFAHVELNVALTAPKTPEMPQAFQNDPVQAQQWMQTWLASEQGLAWKFLYEIFEQKRRESPSLRATVDRDGSFRIEDVPAGVYKLEVLFTQDAPGRLAEHIVEIPDAADATPVNVGTLTLQ